METIVVFSAKNSTRLKFVLDWLLKERLQLEYTIAHNEQDTATLPFFISYGKQFSNSFSIPDDGLLWQTGKQHCDVKAGKWNDLPTLFAADSDDEYTLPFDLFSAIFFLLSRYEEYYHYRPDKHNRFPANNSILFKLGWLERPIADEWVATFRIQLQAAVGHIPATPFLFQPTYDIDMAYSHIHKGFGRIAGAYIRAMLKGDVKQINERTQVLKKKQKDPFDSFRWLRQLHREYNVKPLYFILSAMRTTAYDKNIPPRRPAMIRVIKNIAKDGLIGIHPSYYSDEGDKMSKEIKILEHICGQSIHISRQHYIRMKIPGTCRLLLKNNIKEDYSMGYGSHLGFRAGTGNSFLWYDLEKEIITSLRIHPFCFMDTTAHYEANLSPSEAFEKLYTMSRILEKTGSTLITIFHNFSLGTGNEWSGWRQLYEHFVQEKSKI